MMLVVIAIIILFVFLIPIIPVKTTLPGATDIQEPAANSKGNMIDAQVETLRNAMVPVTVFRAPISVPAVASIHTATQIKGWGWVNRDGQWVHPGTNAVGHMLPDGRFVNQTAGKIFDPIAYAVGQSGLSDV